MRAAARTFPPSGGEEDEDEEEASPTGRALSPRFSKAASEVYWITRVERQQKGLSTCPEPLHCILPCVLLVTSYQFTLLFVCVLPLPVLDSVLRLFLSGMAAISMQPSCNRVVCLRILRSGQTTSSGGGVSLARVAAGASGSTSGIAGDPRKAKRKKEAPDLDAIDDIAERRKQRRLAKNRATAAVSR